MDKSRASRILASKTVVSSEDGCWLWQGSLSDLGYGRVKIQKRAYGVHRLAYYLANDEWPEPECMHLCDVRNCVNPAHLRAGTHAENMADMARKGRAGDSRSPGERNGRARLTEDQVREIRELYATGATTYRNLSQVYGVSEATVQFAVNRKTWRHLD